MYFFYLRSTSWSFHQPNPSPALRSHPGAPHAGAPSPARWARGPPAQGLADRFASESPFRVHTHIYIYTAFSCFFYVF